MDSNPDPVGTRRWSFEIAGDDRAELPDFPRLADAVNAVLADLRATLDPRVAALYRLALSHVPSCSWNTGIIGVRDTVVHQSGFAAADEVDFAHAAAGIADAVSTHLSGYEFVQWPTVGGRFLVATSRDGADAWVDESRGTIVAPIGKLEP